MSRERVALVNENDEVIGSKWRDELTDSDCWRIIAVWIENSEGQVLMQKRSMDKVTSPGCWTAAVEGTVEEGDSYDKTAERELAEEIGLTGFVPTQNNKKHYKAEFGGRVCQAYTVICDWPIEKFVIQKSEVAELKWFNKDVIMQDISEGSSKERLYPNSLPFWLQLFNLK